MLTAIGPRPTPRRIVAWRHAASLADVARRHAGVARRRGAALLVVAGLAGCGSSRELPPAAGPDRSPPLARQPAGRVVPLAEAPGGDAGVRAVVDAGRKLAVVRPTERTLELFDRATGERLASAPAGAGPTRVVAGERGLAYVIDTAGDGLLVFETHGRLRILRRYPLLGAPYGVAADLDAGRLWITLTARNELLELATSARPHLLDRHPTVRQPNEVAVGPDGVVVRGETQAQVLAPRRTR